MGRQEWSRSVERDRSVLERIRALLLALAALTHRSASLPVARRMHLLAILGHGEAMARDFILAMASDPGAPARLDAASDAATVKLVPEAGDAAVLAARFRVLALALGVMLALAGSSRGFVSLLSPPPTLSPGHKLRQSQFTPLPALRATSPPARGEKSQRRQRCSFLRTGQCARSLSALALTRGSAHP